MVGERPRAGRRRPLLRTVLGTVCVALLFHQGPRSELLAQAAIINSINSVGSINNVLYANAFSGADACAQIQGAINALPSTGGTVDARGITAATLATTCAGGITLSGDSQVLLLPQGEIDLGTNGLLVSGSHDSAIGSGLPGHGQNDPAPAIANGSASGVALVEVTGTDAYLARFALYNYAQTTTIWLHGAQGSRLSDLAPQGGLNKVVIDGGAANNVLHDVAAYSGSGYGLYVAGGVTDLWVSDSQFDCAGSPCSSQLFLDTSGGSIGGIHLSNLDVSGSQTYASGNTIVIGNSGTNDVRDLQMSNVQCVPCTGQHAVDLLTVNHSSISNVSAEWTAPPAWAALNPSTTIPINASYQAGGYVVVTNGANSNDCAAGGGSTPVQCKWNGSSWAYSSTGPPVTLGMQIFDSNGDIEIVTTAGNIAMSQPSWNATTGGTTTDGTAVWTNNYYVTRALELNTVSTSNISGFEFAGEGSTAVTQGVIFDAGTLNVNVTAGFVGTLPLALVLGGTTAGYNTATLNGVRYWSQTSSSSMISDSVGNGAPSGSCTTGSTYRNQAGGAGVALYVCQAGAWVAK